MRVTLHKRMESSSGYVDGDFIAVAIAMHPILREPVIYREMICCHLPYTDWQVRQTAYSNLLLYLLLGHLSGLPRGWGRLAPGGTFKWGGTLPRGAANR